MTGWFTKDVAKIYVDEVRLRVDPTVVPVFPPDTALDVGDTVSLDDGRLVRKGTVKGREGLTWTEPEENPITELNYASAAKVSVGGTVTVPNPLGGQLAKSTLAFSKGRSVAVSFKPGVERRVPDSDTFAADIMKLWRAGQLNPTRMVVWSVRRAGGGTVVVSQEGDNQVEVFADSALLGPAGLTLANLSVGVDFGTERKATWKISSADGPMVTSVRLLRLSDDQHAVLDGFGFEDARIDLDAHPELARPAELTAEDLLAMI